MCPGDLAGGGTGQGLLARKDHSYINVPWRRREAARSSKQRMAQAERDCLILSGNTTSHTRSCPSRRPGREQRVLCEAGRRRGSDRRGSLLPPKPSLGLGAHCPAAEAHTSCWLLKALQLKSLSSVPGCYCWILRSKGHAPVT